MGLTFLLSGEVDVLVVNHGLLITWPNLIWFMHIYHVSNLASIFCMIDVTEVLVQLQHFVDSL